ncbi:DUF397 domain-containing protein [Streptomyces sp. NPDC088789]|uniref:DUF397 domain-containing protein n=1 Tax=Streptomyces sp. NPDC088789 TaxID=3365899 RepID=UPI003814CB89
MSVEPELAWFKSSYSTGSGGECVEVAVRPHVVHVRASKDVARPGPAGRDVSVESEPAWFKSSYSTGDGGECVEVALRRRVVQVRDSKDVARPGLVVGTVAWRVFVGSSCRDAGQCC